MRPISLFLLLLASSTALVSGAFNPEDYLYPGEDASSIQTSEISALGETYTLVKIGGQEAFLLKGGVALTNSTSVYNAMRESILAGANFDARKAEIRQKIILFNSSRNRLVRPGSIFRVEQYCKLVTGLVLTPCDTMDECVAAASLTCARYEGQACDAGILGRGMLEFSVPSMALDRDMRETLSLIDSMTVGDAPSKLDSIRSKLPQMRSNAERMSHSILRNPAPNDPCNQGSYSASHYQECYFLLGVCYPMEFDYSSLTAAENAASELGTAISPVASLEATAVQISTSTQERIDFKENSALIKEYTAKFEAAKRKHLAIVAEVERLSPLVSDAPFQSAANALITKGNDIERSIASKQFSGLDARIAEYSSLALAANATLPNASKSYGDTVKMQDAASDSLLEAEWAINPSDKAVVSDFGKLKARQGQLDASFRPPKTSAQYVSLQKNYSALASDAKSFTGGRARNLIFSISGAAGKSGTDSLLALASTVRPLPYKERVKLAPSMPPILLVLTSLSLVSLALVAFAGVLVAFRDVFRHKLFLALWVLALLGFFAVVGAGSVGAYLILNSSSPGSTLSEFMSDVRAGGAAYLLVDANAASADAVLAMESCAGKLSSTLKSEGIAVSTYKIAGTTCSIGGQPSKKTSDACLNAMAGSPIFHLKYSQEPRAPQFSLLVSKEATVAGDSAYMARCQIEDAISNP